MNKDRVVKGIQWPHEQITWVVSHIREVFADTQIIYLFGSAVRGTLHAESDIDLAILTPTKASAESFWNLAQTLAIGLDKDVDLVDLKSASTVMQFQIVRYGARLWCHDDYEANRYETAICSLYTELQDFRAPMIKRWINEVKGGR